MKILITGCSGMLGNDLCNVLGEHELYGVDIRKPNYEIRDMRYEIFDITDFKKTHNVITKINPDILIHTAGYTDVDGCEKNIDLTFKVNCLGTRNLSIACQRFDTEMLYISTDYVFDGKKKEPYTEFDIPNPLSVYGKSKLYGEIYVRDLLNRFYIIRTSWLFGKSGKNFVKTILKLSEEKKEIKVVDDQTGSPTYTKDLAETIKNLLIARQSDSMGLYGIYHITNSGSCSWYEFAKEIIRQSGIKCRVSNISTDELNRPAKRPKNSVLENFIWKLSGFKPLRNWKDALKDYMEGT